MPRFLDSIDESRRSGTLAVEARTPDFIEVFYTPSDEAIDHASSDSEREIESPVKLLEIHRRTNCLTIFPTYTRPWNSDFLKPKYPQIRRIKLEGYIRFDHYIGESEDLTDEEIMMILEDLPSCFVKDYDYGLGFTQGFRFIVNAVEHLSGCTEIVLSNRNTTGPDEENVSFNIAKDDFEEIRRSIARTVTTSQTAARSVNAAKTHNFLAERIGGDPIPVQAGRSTLRRRLTKVALTGEDSLSMDEQNALVRELTENDELFASVRPEKIVLMQRSIELITLDKLVQEYGDLIRKKASEAKWQSFLNDNPLVLSVAFGYPVIKVREQASVGGRKLSGSGDKITDFLLKNSMTNNCAIVEIKRPASRLLNAGATRSGIYTPASDLVSGINQALDQKYRFEREIAQIKENSGLFDIASYSVQCCLIIGTMPGDEERIKSFELFRGNSKDVAITTFDEVLLKLEHLRDFLTVAEDQPSNGATVEKQMIRSEVLPF